ncbi:GPO family capsid scaffolding protein [Aggregatibacter actinomycetemcomitans]|uniref:GPO family capsid scaffolding protein n=1 Tax=Aggregatibacter actinomycetemcomitans TaxID=714 RepID=UPI00197B7646|nr:GPO family capsid scaffolding protein [Aggregatibacter actinomycetemcomitans]MBN6079883.1 GPO family capsid scaffolding protein [Aggregatibacter actinomycetemcomitans]
MSKTTSKWFVVASEGATTDGRVINRAWIEQMAKNYDPKTYGARVNLEHIKFRLYWQDEPHSKCYGDVTALKAEENKEGKLQLFAQIDPTADLIALNKDRQKIYTSIEVDPNFADTGEAYLVGLAVTDTPASLGTEMLQFSAHAHANPLNSRKEKADNLFTAAIETALEFEEVAPEQEKPNFFTKIKALFGKESANKDERFTEHEKAIELLSEQVISEQGKAAELLTQLTQLQKDQADLLSKVTDLQGKFAELEKQPTADYTPRPKVAGEKAAEEDFIY